MKLQRKNNYQKQRKILCNDLKMINPPKDSDSYIQQTRELQNNIKLRGWKNKQRKLGTSPLHSQKFMIYKAEK